MRHPVSVPGDERAPAYHEVVPDLAHAYLEDSWVLGIERATSALIFTLDLVLTPAHPVFRPSQPNEVHRYRRATMHSSVGPSRGLHPADSAASTTWELTGDRGASLVSRPRVRIEFHDGV
jgi:hypothetical protein